MSWPKLALLFNDKSIEKYTILDLEIFNIHLLKRAFQARYKWLFFQSFPQSTFGREDFDNNKKDFCIGM